MEMTNSEVIGLARPGHIPAAGPSAPPPGGSITIPSLRTRQGVPSFAAEWCRCVPGLLLVPLRRRPPGRPKWNDRAGIVWEPVDAWWERPGDSRELVKLLKDDDLGIGLRLGRPKAGGPWVVDVLAHKPGVARRQLDVDSSRTVSWEDEEGIHHLYLGDDGLEALGGESGLIVDEARFLGVEIRLGSLCVLPPTPRARGGRRWFRCNILRSLPEVLCNRLFEATATTTVVCIESPHSASDPAERDLAGGPDVGVEVSEAVAPAEIVQVAGESGEASPVGLARALPDLADRIRAAHLGCVRSMAEALGYYRQAGDLLLEAKGRVGHGQFQGWVAANCGFSYRTAAVSMKVSLNWPEAERWMAANLQRDAPSTLGGLTRPSRGRSHRGPRARASRPASHPSEMGRPSKSSRPDRRRISRTRRRVARPRPGCRPPRSGSGTRAWRRRRRNCRAQSPRLTGRGMATRPGRATPAPSACHSKWKPPSGVVLGSRTLSTWRPWGPSGPG